MQRKLYKYKLLRNKQTIEITIEITIVQKYDKTIVGAMSVINSKNKALYT